MGQPTASYTWIGRVWETIVEVQDFSKIPQHLEEW